jgi:hypothetical protein
MHPGSVAELLAVVDVDFRIHVDVGIHVDLGIHVDVGVDAVLIAG